MLRVCHQCDLRSVEQVQGHCLKNVLFLSRHYLENLIENAFDRIACQLIICHDFELRPFVQVRGKYKKNDVSITFKQSYHIFLVLFSGIICELANFTYSLHISPWYLGKPSRDKQFESLKFQTFQGFKISLNRCYDKAIYLVLTLRTCFNNHQIQPGSLNYPHSFIYLPEVSLFNYNFLKKMGNCTKIALDQVQQ